MSRSLKEQYLFLKLRATRDPEVYGKLYDIYVDQIYRFIYFKVPSREEAEDLTSEVFLKTWQYISGENSGKIENLRAFLYQTARNSVIDFYRTKGLPDESLDEDSEATDQPKIEVADPKQDLVRKIELCSDFETAKKNLQKLKSEYQEAIVLRFVEELSIDEIASITGKAEGTVRVLLHRAVTALKKTMNQKNSE